jgi:hypothetical protein
MSARPGPSGGYHVSDIPTGIALSRKVGFEHNRDFSPIVAVSLSNSYRLRPLVAPALFLHEPRDSNVCGRSMMPCGNPFCGWLVDREADRLLHKFNRLESRQINLSSLLQEEAWGSAVQRTSS